MTLPQDWQDGQLIHGADINNIAGQVNDNTTELAALNYNVASQLFASQPTAMYCTLPRGQQNEVTVNSGELNLTYFQAPSGLAVSNVATSSMGTAAASVTLAKVGIFEVDGSGNLTLIGSTPNTTNLYANTYLVYETAFTASVSLTQGHTYAVGTIIVAGTPPTMVGSYTTSDANLAPRLCGLLTGQTDLPSSITAGAVASNYRAFYARLS